MQTDSKPQQTAEQVAQSMQAYDNATRELGIELIDIAPGRATMRMAVRDDMLNGFHICHGGIITTLADSSFAYACNSHGELTVAAGLTVDFVASAHDGDVLTAIATETALAGRTGVYDVVVTNQNEQTIALMRGRSHRLKGRSSIPDAAAGN